MVVVIVVVVAVVVVVIVILIVIVVLVVVVVTVVVVVVVGGIVLSELVLKATERNTTMPLMFVCSWRGLFNLVLFVVVIVVVAVVVMVVDVVIVVVVAVVAAVAVLGLFACLLARLIVFYFPMDTYGCFSFGSTTTLSATTATHNSHLTTNSSDCYNKQQQARNIYTCSISSA
jgi:hypothetical protein